MHTIGLTGSSGSGKSTVSGLLQQQGFMVIDCDLIAREVVAAGSPCLEKIIDAFGETVRGIDGSLNRRTLADIVFHDKNKLALLNSIMYPEITNHIRSLLQQYASDGIPFVILDAPTLFESGADSLCDATVSVISTDPLRIQRIMERDHIDEAMAISRLHSQQPTDFYREHSDYIIENSGSLRQLEQQTQNFISKLRLLPPQEKSI